MSCSSAAACRASSSGPFDPQVFRDFDGVDANPLQVLVRGVIFGFDGQREGFNRAQMQVGHFLDVAFFVFELAQIEAIGAVDQINRRHQQQRGFPVKSLVEPADGAGNSGSDQVVRERPEIAVHQNAHQRTPLGHRNDHRDRARVGDEIDGGRDAEQYRPAVEQQVG